MHKDVFEKFFHFAHAVIENYEELGLSRDTAKKIVELKIKTKKDMIKDAADVEMVTVDIFAESFMALKKMMTPEQLKKTRSFCKVNK